VRPKSDFSRYKEDVSVPTHPDVIFAAVLDKKYGLEIQRLPTSEYQGQLYILDLEAKKVIYKEITPVAYGAPFGPDSGDVEEWYAKCIDVVDKLNGTK